MWVYQAPTSRLKKACDGFEILNKNLKCSRLINYESCWSQIHTHLFFGGGVFFFLIPHPITTANEPQRAVVKQSMQIIIFEPYVLVFETPRE